MASHWEIVNNNRNVISDTPEKLWNNAIGYFQWCDDNPIKTIIPITTGKEAGMRQVQKIQPRMYTVEGMCLHCNVEEDYIKSMRNVKDNCSEYAVVISKILHIIYIQNLEYAAVEVFNGGFISKVLNMEKEKAPVKDIKVEIVTQKDLPSGDRMILPELSETENQILEKLELELSLAEKSEDENPERAI